ncbi:MAG: hypothetical protein B7Z80_18995 [Rhodospirillales bacterium 20-64-7]|nr:MAG: hypothetical protein B7Z80_18995 [Rhodospirillales bacterium 20-64-7]
MCAPIAAPIVAIDWGTSSFRLWALDAGGTVLAEAKSGEGANGLDASGFDAVLRRHLAELSGVFGDATPPVVMCGMVGARYGWREAAYVDVPAPLTSIAGSAIAAPFPAQSWILPGLAQRSEAAPDVIRGEETQLLGLTRQDAAFTGTVCMPGTHSKWVRMAQGRVTGFHTAMTGELFALLAQHSTLRQAMAGAAPTDENSDAFAAGARAGLAAPEDILHALFGIRAATLLLGATPDEAAARASGLLIGAEIVAALRRAPVRSVTLVGAGALGRCYRKVFEMAGCEVSEEDGFELARRGLFEAARQLLARAAA